MNDEIKLMKVDTDKYKMQTSEAYVPFVSEVEEFNSTMGKPNNS